MIVLLRHAVFLLLTTVAGTGPGMATALELTPEEQIYISTKRPIMCADPDWAPFERFDADGQHIGIAADLHRLLRERIGLEVSYFPQHHWQEQLRASKEGRCQILSFVNQTPERDQWLIFTQPLLSDPNVLITREEAPLIENLSLLTGKRMALPAGTAIYERISRDFPNVELIPTASEEEAIGLVANKQADMTLRSLIVAAYTIKRNGWFNLKINSQLHGYENHLRIGVLKAEPLLKSILDKGIASISNQERDQIIDRHVEIKMVTAIDYSLLKWVIGIAFSILLTSYYWLRRLQHINRSLQAALTEVKNTEAEQRQFISMLSHEIRSPLAVIDTTAQLLGMKLQDRNDCAPLLARIRRGTARLSTLLDNSLTQDRLNSKNFILHRDTVDLPTLLSNAIDSAELLTRQHEIVPHLAPELPPLQGDQTLLRIMLNNLVGNAIKYCPAGTAIELSISASDDNCKIEVIDHGPGIPPEDLPHIFERFHRGRNAKDTPGAGLGIPLIDKIVKLHQGRLAVECPPSGGTRFTIHLPFSRKS